MKTVPRPLIERFAEITSEMSAASKTDNFPYKFDAAQLLALHESGLCWIREDRSGHKILACIVIGQTDNPTYFELKNIWVHPKFRRAGLGRHMSVRAFHESPRNSTLFILSDEQEVARQAIRFGFTEAIDWQHHLTWKTIAKGRKWEDVHQNQRIFVRTHSLAT